MNQHHDHAPHDHAPGHHHRHHHHDHHGGHHHGAHGHDHAPASFGFAFAAGTILNLGFVLVEAGYGIASGSMALVADAGHNLGDVLGLVIAWTASVLAKRAPGGRYTYGLRSSSILAAMLNALILLVATGVIAVEAIGRFFDPEPVAGGAVMVVAGIGIAVNAVTALLFMRGHDDLNIRGAFLHMAADAAISAGVVVAGLIILKTGWSWIDPAVSLVIVLVVAIGTWRLLRDSVDMGLQAAPRTLDLAAIEGFLRARPGVEDIHDLHVWPLSTTHTALTAHLLMADGFPGDGFMSSLARELHDRFGIEHATIQIETDPAAGCMLEPAHVF